jgi:hypothetical protein
LPKKSPWLNAIEPKWIHGKRKVIEPEELISAEELADRVCRVFGCAHDPHLSIPQEAIWLRTRYAQNVHENVHEKVIHKLKQPQDLTCVLW